MGRHYNIKDRFGRKIGVIHETPDYESAIVGVIAALIIGVIATNVSIVAALAVLPLWLILTIKKPKVGLIFGAVLAVIAMLMYSFPHTYRWVFVNIGDSDFYIVAKTTDPATCNQWYANNWNHLDGCYKWGSNNSLWDSHTIDTPAGGFLPWRFGRSYL